MAARPQQEAGLSGVPHLFTVAWPPGRPCLLPAALLVLAPAAARTGVVAADLGRLALHGDRLVDHLVDVEPAAVDAPELRELAQHLRPPAHGIARLEEHAALGVV